MRAAPDKLLSTVPEKFLAFLIACQVALLLPSIGPLRVFVRSGSFGVSLVLLVWLMRNRGTPHPAAKPARWVIAIVALSFFHPYTNGLMSGAAQVAMYVAILAPLFWVARTPVDGHCLKRVLLILFLFHSVSAGFGVLQVYFPGRFQPQVTSWLVGNTEKLNALSITLASGERVLRPMGLTDLPGGAATAGFYAVLLGLGFLVSTQKTWLRAASLGGMSLGMFCLYLAQVRSLLILAAICVIAFTAFLAWRGRIGRLTGVLILVPVIVAATFGWATSLGGESVSGRLESLVKEDPGTVYYKNRGVFLEETLTTKLEAYPLGAGLGRWGMMHAYFGDYSSPERGLIWVEIQWTGWLVDGGIPLVLAYLITLLVAMWVAWRIASRSNPGASRLWLYSAIILAYDLGALALCFNNTVFLSQMGLELWLLNAALFAAYLGERGQRSPGVNTR